MISNNLDDIRLKAKSGLPFAYYFSDKRDEYVRDKLRIILKWNNCNIRLNNLESRYFVDCIEHLSVDALGDPVWKPYHLGATEKHDALIKYALIKMLSELLEVPVDNLDNREC